MSTNGNKVHEGRRLNFIFQAVVLIIIAVGILYIARPIVLPFLFAVFLAIILDPIVQLAVRFRIPHALAVTFTILFTFFLFYLLGLIVYASTSSFSEQWPLYERKFGSYINSLTLTIEDWLGASLQKDLLQKIDWLGAIQEFSLTQRAISSVGTFVSFIGNVLLVLIFIVYLLIGKQNLFSKIHRAFREEKAEKIIGVIDNIIQQVQTYLGTKTLVSLITAVLSYILFLSFGLDFAVIWAIMIFVLNYIPNFGSILASLLPILISLIQFESLWAVLWMAVILMTIQFAIGNVIEPRVMGRRLGLSTLVVFLSLVLWSWIFGPLGMLLSAPLTAILKIVLENTQDYRAIAILMGPADEEEPVES